MSFIKRYIRTHTNPPVFLTSGLLMILMVGWASLAPRDFAAVANQVDGNPAETNGWL